MSKSSTKGDGKQKDDLEFNNETNNNEATTSNDATNEFKDNLEDAGIADSSLSDSNSSYQSDQLVALKRLSKARDASLDQAYENLCACKCFCKGTLKSDCSLNRSLIKLSDGFQSLNLNPIIGWSRKYLEELNNLHNVTLMIIGGDLNDGLKKGLNNSEIAFELQSFGVSKFIQAFKFLPKFRLLCKEDQKRLLQPCCSALLLLRSTKHFDSLKEEWKVNSCSNKDNIKLSFDIMKENHNQEDLHYTYLRFCENVRREWREDDLIMTIVLVIVLYSSAKVILDKKLSA